MYWHLGLHTAINMNSVTLTRKSMEESRGEEHGLAGKAAWAAHPWRAAKPGARWWSPSRLGRVAGCPREKQLGWVHQNLRRQERNPHREGLTQWEMSEIKSGGVRVRVQSAGTGCQEPRWKWAQMGLVCQSLSIRRRAPLYPPALFSEISQE